MEATRSGAGRSWRRAPLARPVTLGLQRVLRVRVAATADGLVLDAIGVFHRRPVVQPISVMTASALLARGVPLTVRRTALRPAGAG